jgi:outer membrane receptor protein involved in Fe transport
MSLRVWFVPLSCLRGRGGHVCLQTWGLVTLVFCRQVFAEESGLVEFAIPKESAEKALTSFAQQADVPILFPFDSVSGFTANALVGEYTVREGLKVLLDDTGLSAVLGEAGQVVVRVEESGGADENNNRPSSKGRDGWRTDMRDTLSSISARGVTGAAVPGAVLEEIVVTAQRRRQSLQEVPISIEAILGGEIRKQGYRNLNELSNFSPSVYIDDSGFSGQDRSIRGFGTVGRAVTLEQAVPIFVDGIHFGRPAQVKLAFMDPARIEVLKGPQPVYFGMNATAGAFNIVSARPTPEWEGYLDTEAGNFGDTVLRGAVGGPLSDTVGIRVAGTYENSDGFIRDVVTGDMAGDYENVGARVMLKFTPSERLGVTTKLEYSKITRDSDVTVLCLTDGPMVYTRNNDGTQAPLGYQGNERSIWAPPPQGIGWVKWPDSSPLKKNCAGDLGDRGINNSGPYFQGPDDIRDEDMNYGAIDIREAAAQWMRIAGSKAGRIDGLSEELESPNGYVEVEYQFDNDVVMSWLTGFSLMNRINASNNGNVPFLAQIQDRDEEFTQYSSELRFTSGPGRIEWMGGVLWQDTDLDFWSNAPKANTHRGLRSNVGFEKQEWKTAFATVTFNFRDDKASIDIGGRYTDLDKTGGLSQVTAQWVFDVNPCDPQQTDPPGGGDVNPSTCPLHPDAVRITPAETTFLLPGADMSNLWIMPWRASRYTPSSWINGRAYAVGLGTLAPRESNEGPYGPGNGGDFSSTNFDPQVTLRYRPNDKHSLFLRYAKSFKAGGFDTGVVSLPRTVEDFRYEPESGWTIEVGSKGSLWGGRARYDATLFQTTFSDFQVQSATGRPEDPFVAINAGEQRVRGVEFSLTGAITDRLTLSVGGTLMDGEFTYFPNAGCNEFELAQAATGPCLSSEEAEALNGLDADGDPIGEGTIDRTGTPAPKTPDWKFVFGVDWQTPIFDTFQLNLNARGYISDGYLIDSSGLSPMIKMDQHGDLNVILGIGPRAGPWEVALYGHNLLEAKVSYHPEYDVFDNGLAGLPGDGGVSLSRSNFATYGLKFMYSFFQ